MLNERKFAFIICANNDMFLKECMAYINNIEIPEGYTADVLVVSEAASMCAGYNEGMEGSDAKYKIYLHQDVMLCNPKILYEVLECFKDPNVGMLGAVGNRKLQPSANMSDGTRIGLVELCGTTDKSIIGENPGCITDVEALDGLLLITQYDIRWREDIFDGWDFYDLSQCREFMNKGYRVCVPHFDRAWCMHYYGLTLGKLTKYDHYRQIYQDEYMRE